MEETFVNNFKHTPVLLSECLSALNIKPDGIYVDGTLGGGGHSGEILKRLTTGRLIAFDKDEDALKSTSQKLRKYENMVTYIKDDFKNMAGDLKEIGIESVDGILLDLGVSSYQLDTAERGFSYRFDSRLDMRMDKSADLDAYKVVNTYPKEELLRILYNYGEESFAKSIVAKILEARENKAIETTGELVSLIESAIPKKFWGRGSVAKKTFQAIRIEVNSELLSLEKALPDMFEALKSGGVMAIITFHSLEDKIVKDYFRTLKEGCTCPKDFPVCVCGKKPKAVVRSGGKKASQKEVQDNKRSRSAKLRTAVKL